MKSSSRRCGTLDRALELHMGGGQDRGQGNRERAGSVMGVGSQGSRVAGRSGESRGLGWKRAAGRGWGAGSAALSAGNWRVSPSPSPTPPPPPPRPLPLRLRLREITSQLRGSHSPHTAPRSPRLYRHIYCNNKVRRRAGGGGRLFPGGLRRLWKAGK